MSEKQVVIDEDEKKGAVKIDIINDEDEIRVVRAFRLNNLKRIAEKNQAFSKIVKQKMIQTAFLSVACILLGVVFVHLSKTSGTTKIVEHSLTGVGALVTFILSIKSFMSHPEDKEDNVEIKFSEIKNDSKPVGASIENSDEDEIRNVERTVEKWNNFLSRKRLIYTGVTILGSFLILVFIALDVFSQDHTLLMAVNSVLIAIGGITLICCIYDLLVVLKRYSFSDEGEKDVERVLNGVKIHIDRSDVNDFGILILELKDLYKNNRKLKREYTPDEADKIKEIQDITEVITELYSKSRNEVTISELLSSNVKSENKEPSENTEKKEPSEKKETNSKSIVVPRNNVGILKDLKANVHELYEKIKVAEKAAKFNIKKCFINVDKHFGRYLTVVDSLPDLGKGMRYPEKNMILLSLYFALGKLCMENEELDKKYREKAKLEGSCKKNAELEKFLYKQHIPFSELQLRKARNIYDLFTELDIKEGEIKPIKTRYATIIFALCDHDVKYIVKTYKYGKEPEVDKGRKWGLNCF